MTKYKSLWNALMDVKFEQSWVSANGIQTRYAHAGQLGKPPVLMLHGTAGSWETFAENLGPLSRDFDCYAIDLVGCGLTDKPDVDFETFVYANHVKDFLQALNLGPAHLIGCSLGGWVAARTAVEHPGKVASITFTSAAGYHSDSANMSRIKGQRTKAVDDPTWENVKPIFDSLIHDEANRIPDIIAVRQRIYQRPDMSRAMTHILCLQDAEIRQRNVLTDAEWKSIAVPTLVIGSLEDKSVYLETAKVISKLMPRAKYVEMESVGHWPHFEDPATFNKHVIDFLKSQTDGRSD